MAASGAPSSPASPHPCGTARNIAVPTPIAAAPAGALPIVGATMSTSNPGNNIIFGDPRSGPLMGADDFGASKPAILAKTGVPTLLTNGWVFNGTFNTRYYWNVRPNLGPQGQRDVPGAGASIVTINNFVDITEDLWPYPTTCGGGRPARKRYWSRLLTIDHELFHVMEFVAAAQQATSVVETWMMTQSTDGTQADAQTRLFPAMQALWVHEVEKRMAFPGDEIRAYSAGRADYVALAFDVFDKY